MKITSLFTSGWKLRGVEDLMKCHQPWFTTTLVHYHTGSPPHWFTTTLVHHLSKLEKDLIIERGANVQLVFFYIYFLIFVHHKKKLNILARYVLWKPMLCISC